MILQVVSIKDAVTGAYSQPSFVLTTSQAVRSFQDMCEDTNSNLHKHPADYELMHIGTFDDELGVLTPLTAEVNGVTAYSPRSIARAIDCVSLTPVQPVTTK